MVNLDRCGRGKTSHICDPELLLDPKVLDGLDEKIHIDHGLLRHLARAALRSAYDPSLVLQNLVRSVLELWSDESMAESLLTVDRSRLLFYLLTCSLGVVAILLVACFAYDIFSQWRHQARFRLCKNKVEKVHDAFGQRHAECVQLCPICIEQLPACDTNKACAHAVTFLCGHRFHTDCANSWFMFNDAPGRCPICELPHTYSAAGGKAARAEESEQPSATDEIKAFFLTSLRA